MVGWIKMPLGTEVGLGPGHIVLDGDPAPSSHGKGHSSPPHPTFTIYGPRQACVRLNGSPCLLWPNGWMDQDATWYGGRPQPRRHCVAWGPSSPQYPRKGAQPPSHTHFSAHVCCGPAVAHLSNCWAFVKYLLLQGDTSGDYKRLLMGLVRGRWISVMSTTCIKCPEEIIARVAAAAAAAGCAVFIECVLPVEFSTLRLSDSEIVLLAFFSRS